MVIIPNLLDTITPYNHQPTRVLNAAHVENYWRLHMLRSRTPNDPSAPALCSMINSGVLSVVYVENFGRRLPEPESKKSCHSGYFFCNVQIQNPGRVGIFWKYIGSRLGISCLISTGIYIYSRDINWDVRNITKNMRIFLGVPTLSFHEVVG